MKKKAMAIVMAAATAVSLMAGSLSVSAATEPDTSAEKTIKVLSIWAEDSADGKILTGILDNYIKDVNPNFSYEYEYVSSSDLSTKVLSHCPVLLLFLYPQGLYLLCPFSPPYPASYGRP